MTPHDTSIDGSQHAVRYITDRTLHVSAGLMLGQLLLSSTISPIVEAGEREHVEDEQRATNGCCAIVTFRTRFNYFNVKEGMECLPIVTLRAVE